MSEAVRVERTVVVLSSMIWRSELESELQRIGVAPDQAQRSAGHLLGRIVRHAGWVRNSFLFDAADEVDMTEVGGVEHRTQSSNSAGEPGKE